VEIQIFVHFFFLRAIIIFGSIKVLLLHIKKKQYNIHVCERILEEGFKDTKGVIRIRKSKKDRQHNGQKKRDKQRSTKDTHKTKDRVTPTPLYTGVNSGREIK
jgi:hypothetical protein